MAHEHCDHDHHGHDHDHGHHHGHQHTHGESLGHVHVTGSSLKVAFYLNLAIVLVQLVGGLLAHSLAVLGDAGHNAADAFAIGLAWYARLQAERPASSRLTYGYHRAGILVALANSLSLIVIAAVLCFEAVGRVLHPQPVHLTPLFVTAVLGLGFNAYAALRLAGDQDVNIRSAFLHLLGDAAASAGVIVGGVVMLLTGWHWVDPLLSVGIAVLIAFGAWDVVRRTVRILMEGTPEHVQPAEIAAAIQATHGVQSVHDVHVWSVAAGRNALSCHVVVDGQRTIAETQPLLATIEQQLAREFRISHATIQLESADHGHGDGCGAPLSR